MALRATLEQGTTPDIERRIAAAPVLVTSRLSLVEAARALFRVRLQGDVSEQRLADARRELDVLCSRCELWELSAAVCELASSLRVRGSRVLLETHGLAVEAVSTAAGVVDVVSMDWKLSSNVRRESDARHGPVADFHDAHEAFLKRALESVTAGATVYVKAVVTSSTRDDELREMSERIARVSVKTPLILQPVTPSGPVREAPAVERMFACLRLCQERLADVRLIPQTHKSLGVR